MVKWVVTREVGYVAVMNTDELGGSTSAFSVGLYNVKESYCLLPWTGYENWDHVSAKQKYQIVRISVLYDLLSPCELL